MECIYCGNHFEVNRKGSGGTNRKTCYDCLPEGLDKKQRTKRRWELNVEKARKQKKELGCSRCGYNKNSSALEWHHPEGVDKDVHPTNALKRSWDKYLEEISGCTLLCANCHREEHYPESL